VSLNYHNNIQVYGLPRSGTNFMEWTLRNNFYNVDYHNIDAINEVKGSGPHLTLKKHNYPILDTSEGIIVIYKEFDEWRKSLKRGGMNLLIDREAHQNYIDRAKEFDSSKVLIVEHEWCLNHYYKLLERISIKFGLELKHDWEQPLKRMSTDGGVTLTNEDYVSN